MTAIAASLPTIAFKTINVPAGTDPVATVIADTLNLTSVDASVTISGDAITKTIDFSTATAAGGTDHHSGWYYIAAAALVTVVLYKQMTVWETLTVDGTLNVDGQLRIEP